MTRRALQLIDAARNDRLTPAEFAYVRAGFFPDVAKQYAEQLRTAGPLQRTTLLERRAIGDDRVYLYELIFVNSTLRFRLGLAPDGRIALFALSLVARLG